MAAAEPPDEAEDARTSSPWRRPEPGWTLFDALWAASRRDEVELRPASIGRAAPSTSANTGAQIDDARAAPTPTAPVPSGGDGGAPLDVPADERVGDGATSDLAAGAGGDAATPPIAPAEPDDARARAQAIAIAIAIEAIMAETELAVREAPYVVPEAVPSAAGHDGGPAILTSTTLVEARASEPGSKAPTQLGHARHAKRPTTWARVGRGLGLLVLAGVLACIGIGVFALVQGTWAINPVLSGSMRPGFAVGSVVISQQVPVDQLALRDVIVFQDPLTPSEQIVHRIVGMSIAHDGVRTFVTQGDANATHDPWRLQIRGATVYRVRWSIPLLGYVAIAYENHRGIALIIAGALLVLAAIPTVARRRRKQPPQPASEAGAREPAPAA